MSFHFIQILYGQNKFLSIGVRSYTGDNGQQFVIGPEFCGGALSKGGNAIAAESDNVGGLIKSKFVIFNKYFIPPMIIHTYNPSTILFHSLILHHR